MFALRGWLLALLLCASGSVAIAADGNRRILVCGSICDRKAHQGVGDVELVLSNGSEEVTVRTNTAGKYEGFVLPGLITGRIESAPVQFALPQRAFRGHLVLPDGAKQLELPPIELPRGRGVRGQVLDDNDQPVPGAEVQAGWLAMEPWYEEIVFIPRRCGTIADAQGRFTLERLDPDDRVRLGAKGRRIFASAGKNQTSALEELSDDGERPITLRVDIQRSVPLSGRVLDADGRPVAGAAVEIRTQWGGENGISIGYAPIAFAGQTELQTDADGRFHAPTCVARNGEYMANVRAAGFLPAGTTWLRCEDQQKIVFPDLQLARLRTIVGRVIDRQQRPLAGVRVFQSGDGIQRTEATSDAAGRFELSDVSESEAFVFAQGAGFRFHGQPIAANSEPVEIVLARTGEPPVPLSSQRSAIGNHAEELSLIRRVFRPHLERALASDSAEERWSAFFGWNRIHPTDALIYIDNASLPGVGRDEYDFLRGHAAKALFRESPEEAAAIVESIEDLSRRLRAYFELAGAASASQQDFKRRLLEQALLSSQAVEDTSLRAIWLHCVADGFLDLGDMDRGQSTLREAQSLADALPKAGDGGSTRGYVAEALARIDLPAAVNLVQNVGEDRIRDRTFGRMAYRIAASQPAEVERLLERIGDVYRRGELTVPCCYRMAPVDPELARRLADTIVNPYLRAHALGLMVRASAALNRSQALVWAEEAFEILDRIVAAGEERLRGWHHAAMVAALLVAAIEQIDPQLVPEYFWRAVACRRSHSFGNEGDVETATASMALLLAPYDRRIARRVLEPLIERRPDGGDSFWSGVLFDAACVIDVNWAVELLQRLPEEDAKARGQSFFQLAWLASFPPETRIPAVVRNYNWLWLPGEPDNAFQSQF